MLQVQRVFKVSVVLGLTALFAASVAQATGTSNWYLQGKLGNVDLDTRFGTTSPKDFADDDGSASVELGYTVNPNLALQAGYHDLGTFLGAGSPCPDKSFCIAAIAPLRAEVTGVSLSAVPRVPFNERWSAFGKVGAIDWQSDIDFVGVGTAHHRIERFDRRQALTGLGVQYEFPTGLGLLVEHQHFELTGGWTSLGASWRF